MMDVLKQLIQSNPRSQELKRALAVQMTQQGYSYRQIRDVLGVSLGFITHCNQRYDTDGVEGLRLNYWGTQGYLSQEQKQEVLAWLAQKDYCTLDEVIEQLEQQYQVVYQSLQSYYTLLKQAGLSWKKSQPTHADKDEQQVAQKKRDYGIAGEVASSARQWTSAADVHRRVSSVVGRYLWLRVESA